jgi:hypothetical protein
MWLDIWAISIGLGVVAVALHSKSDCPAHEQWLR